MLTSREAWSGLAKLAIRHEYIFADTKDASGWSLCGRDVAILEEGGSQVYIRVGSVDRG